MLSNSNFLAYAAESLFQNLELLDIDFKNILELNFGSDIATEMLKTKYPQSFITVVDNSEKLISIAKHPHKIVADYENLPFKTNKFDLIIFNCGMQWLNDVPRFLGQIFDLLTASGIFITNFIGGHSLKKLRLKLIEAETKANYPHSPHISPFIKFEDTTNLVKSANFASFCTSYETIHISYKNILSLMRDLQNHGASNSLNNKKYYAINKEMYKILAANSAQFDDTIDLISILACRGKKNIKLISDL